MHIGNEEKNKLAIVIPFFKINFFEATLLSLANQTNHDFNLYIGNDGSNDDPLPLIKSILDNKGLNYRYYNYDKNLGSINLSFSWKRIVNEIDDENYVLILGDDDYLQDNFVKAFYDTVQQTKILPITLVRFCAQMVDDKGKHIGKRSTYPPIIPFQNFTKELFSRKIRTSLSENIFSVHHFKKHGFKPYPIGWFTDTMLWLNLCYPVPTISCADTTVFTRVGSTNISGNSQLSDIKNLSGLLYHLDVLESFSLDETVKKDVIQHLIYFLNKNKFSDFYIKRRIFRAKNLILRQRIYFITLYFYKYIKYYKHYRRKHIKSLIRTYVNQNTR